MGDVLLYLLRAVDQRTCFYFDGRAHNLSWSIIRTVFASVLVDTEVTSLLKRAASDDLFDFLILRSLTKAVGFCVSSYSKKVSMPSDLSTWTINLVNRTLGSRCTVSSPSLIQFNNVARFLFGLSSSGKF